MDRVFLLDRSGSMDLCLQDTIGGFNSFVKSQKSLGGTLALYYFDHEFTPMYTKTPINEVEDITTETYVPRGSTALLDAIGQLIKIEQTDGAAKTVVILTDGQENSSRIYTKAHIKDLVTAKEKEGWQFIYLGANQDAFAEAQAMGIAAGRTLNYDVNNTPQLFATVSAAMSQATQSGTPFEF
jgi:hypothetical protein